MAYARGYHTSAEAAAEAAKMREHGWPTAKVERSDARYDYGEPRWYITVGGGRYELDDGQIDRPESHITG